MCQDGAMRVLRTIVVGILLVVVSFMPPAAAEARPPRPAYAWAIEATLIVAGRVESVGKSSARLRISKTLAGRADTEIVEFEPTTHPVCMSGRSGPEPADIFEGDEVALFLVPDKGAAFRVVDAGYAKVVIGTHAARFNSRLASVERLVAAMKATDQDERDRAMIAAATADEEFLRRAACRYVRDDLGLAKPRDRDEDEASDDAHLAAVRRHGAEIAKLVIRENGGEPCGAAIGALADASCAPDGAFDGIVKFARAVAAIDREQLDSACRVIACYERDEAFAVLLELAATRPEILSCLGVSRSPAVRSKLLAEFANDDPKHVVAAASGLGTVLQRGHDEEIEAALLARLRAPIGPTLLSTIAAALAPVRPLDAADAILDRMAADDVSKWHEDAGAQSLRSYLRARPPIAGLRDLLVKRQDVLTKRLDAGRTASVWPLYLLQGLGTPEAMASLRHAATSHPDPEMRQAAKWRSEPLDR